MTEKSISLLEKFIYHNDLSFTVGKRNSDLVLLCGYALHIKASEKSIEAVLAGYVIADPEVAAEFYKVYDYAVDHNYGRWWSDKRNEVDVNRFIPLDPMSIL